MSHEITCPICLFEHIPQERDTCPQCDSDLVCFRLLEELQGKEKESLTILSQEHGPSVHISPEDAKSVEPATLQTNNSGTVRNKFQRMRTATAGGILFLVMVSVFVFGHYALSEIKNLVQNQGTSLIQDINTQQKDSIQMHDLLKNLSIRMESLENEIQKLYDLSEKDSEQLHKIADTPQKNLPSSKDDLGKLKNPIPEKQPSSCFRVYKAREDDTLWEISQKLYGNGIYYPVLLQHNPDLRIYDINSKNILQYLCDKNEVPTIYKSITATKNNRRYWMYTLRPGDTPSTVAKRYCENGKKCFVEDTFPEIGKTIGIFLE